MAIPSTLTMPMDAMKSTTRMRMMDEQAKRKRKPLRFRRSSADTRMMDENDMDADERMLRRGGR